MSTIETKFHPQNSEDELASLRATLDAKDRLLERMAGALRTCQEHLRMDGSFHFYEYSYDEKLVADALKEYAETAPKNLYPAPAPQ